MVKEKRKKPNEKTNTTRRKRNTKDDSHELIKMNQYSTEPEDVKNKISKQKIKMNPKFLKFLKNSRNQKFYSLLNHLPIYILP